MLNEFFSGRNMVIGFYIKFDNNTGVSAIGFYYIEKKIYSMYLNLGIFYLRAKLNDTKFKEEIKNNMEKYNYEYKALINTCALPKLNFMGIMKYIINY